MIRPRIRALRDGSFEVRLRLEERALLGSLPQQLASALDQLPVSGDAPGSLRRLFPPAYVNDERAEQSYGSLMRSELASQHREALETLRDTAGKSRVEAAELEGWLVAVNDLRLVLGTSLGVSEDAPEVLPNDPRFGEWAIYGYLSYLEGEIVEALGGVLPPPVEGAGDDLPEDPWGEPLGDLRWDGTERPAGAPPEEDW
ncbi:MAG TPA: DUF2017 family protein [Acidimicrobiales bacterium]|nr:DUF2017 family protein [Acidimicrobiales bacterium]